MDPDSVIISEAGLLRVLLAIYHLTILTQRSGVTCHSWKNTYCSCSSSRRVLHQPWEHKLCCHVPELASFFFFSKSKTWQYQSVEIKCQTCLWKWPQLARKAGGISQLILNVWVSDVTVFKWWISRFYHRNLHTSNNILDCPCFYRERKMRRRTKQRDHISPTSAFRSNGDSPICDGRDARNWTAPAER